LGLAIVLRTIAITRFTDRVVSLYEVFRLIIVGIGDLIRHSVIGAINDLRQDPQGAFAIRAGAAYRDSVRSDQAHAHIREEIIPHNGVLALDGHHARRV